jgi:hypothetical protein
MTEPYLGNLVGWILSKTVYRPDRRYTSYRECWWTVRLIPKWAVGQTWGDYVFIKSSVEFGDIIGDILMHERIHVEQWRRYGWFGFGFAIRYLYELIVRGYEGNRLEIEARERSR